MPSKTEIHNEPKTLYCRFCGKSILKEDKKNHEKSDCEYVHIENKVNKCRLCGEVLKKLTPKHVQSCKSFIKFLRIIPNGFECRLCPKTITCSAYNISRESMHRHLESKHGIIRQGPITTEDLKNNAGYLFSCTVV